MLRILVLSFFLSSAALAKETPHAIGVNYSYSDINKGSDENISELNDSITSHFAYSYQYSVAEHFSIGLGYLKGDSSKADGLIVDIFTDSKMDYSAIQLSAAVNYPIIAKHYLYLKVNALQYDYDIVDDNEVVYNEDGNDFGFSLGWMFKFDNGIGINAGYEVLNLGKNIDIKGLNIGMNYRF